MQTKHLHQRESGRKAFWTLRTFMLTSLKAQEMNTQGRVIPPPGNEPRAGALERPRTVPLTLAIASVLLVLYNASGEHPEIIDPTNSYAGKTYSEWAASFWQYYTSLPTTNNPFERPSCCPIAPLGTGQSGPVWFLAGNILPGGTYDYWDTVPGGVALFTLVVLSERGNDICIYPPPTEAQMRAYSKAQVDQAINQSVTIDGVAVNYIDNVLTTPYRVQSPLFNYTCPAVQNVLYDVFGRQCYSSNPGGPPFAINGAIVDGVFLMVAPLSAGQHTIRGALTLPQFGIFENWTRNLTVLPVSLTASAGSSAGTLVLTWPQTPDTYTLESSSDVTSSDWQAATNFSIGLTNSIYRATGPAAATNQFFRLRLN